MYIVKQYYLAIVIFCFSLSSLFADVPITFDEAGRMALAASNELKSQYALLAIQQNMWQAGLRSYFPTIGISAREDDTVSERGHDSFQKNYFLTLEQLLFDGGKLLKSRRLEKEKIKLSMSQLENYKANIYENAISLYRKILASREIIAIRKRGLASMEEQRRIMAIQFDLGMSLMSDLAETDINIADTNIAILNAELELKNLEMQFTEILGLEKMPLLLEKINVHDAAVLPDVRVVCRNAQQHNLELENARLAIVSREEELKLSLTSWVPTISANGSFSLNGKRYPLTNYNWSVGLVLRFDTPLLKTNLGASYGHEGRYTQNAHANGSAELVPNPAGIYTSAQARVLLEQERSNYSLLFNRIGKNAELILEKCKYNDEKRVIALKAAMLAENHFRIGKLRFELGEITGLELINIQNELTEKEIKAIQCTIDVRNAERELEKIMDLQPGELNQFTKITKNNIAWRQS